MQCTLQVGSSHDLTRLTIHTAMHKLECKDGQQDNDVCGRVTKHAVLVCVCALPDLAECSPLYAHTA